MRDTIKRKEYFDTFIEEDSERIQNFTNKLNLDQVPKERIGIITERVMSLELGIFIARYSKGDELKDLQTSFSSLFDNWVSNFNANNYDVNLKMISLSVLFGFEDKLKQMIEELNKIDDWLVSYILSGDNQKQLIYEEHYELLQTILKNKQFNELINYVKNEWFDENLDCFFSHKSSNNVYYGYWCFEVAAIIKKLKINDSSLKNTRFYPFDLAHFI